MWKGGEEKLQSRSRHSAAQQGGGEEPTAPLILLVTCSFDAMIWSMSVRMEASRVERAAPHLWSSSSYWEWQWPCTRL